MQNWMLSMINGYGYLGIFLLIFIENVFPPIPSEAVLLFGGALTVSTALNAPDTILAATVGSLTGAIFLYALGRIFQADRLEKILSGKLGQHLHLRPEHVKKAEQWFMRYQGKAVFICRCIPLVRSLISVPAGFACMNIPSFLLLTALGSAIWNTVLVYIGAGLGTAWEKALPYFDQYTKLALAALVLIFLGAIGFYALKKYRKTHKSAPRKDI